MLTTTSVVVTVNVDKMVLVLEPATTLLDEITFPS